MIAGLSALRQALFDGADARFCELTTAANLAFERHDDDAASRLYEQALAEAECLFDAALAGGSPLIAPMAYTIACHNVAEARRRAGDRAAAHGLKRRAVEKLLGTAESPADPLALRVNCVRHLRHAFAFLGESLVDDNTGNRAEFDDLISRYGAIIEKLARVTAHMMFERTSFEPSNDRLPRRARPN